MKKKWGTMTSSDVFIKIITNILVKVSPAKIFVPKIIDLIPARELKSKVPV